MRLSNKNILVLLAMLALVMINQACGRIEDDKNKIYEDQGDGVSSQNVIQSEDQTILSDSNQISENKTVDYVIFNSDEIYCEDMNLVDENIFKIMNEISSSIDYYGAFENSEDDVENKFILEKYYKVVFGEDTYMDMPKERGHLEGEFSEIKPDECTYYSYDMDKDGISELVISDNTRYIYFLKYDGSREEIILTCTIRTTNQLLGDNKVSDWRGGVGNMLTYYELNNNGEMESEIRFYTEDYLNNQTQEDDVVYMVGFPEDSEVIERVKELPQNKKVEVYYDDFTRTHYFRITEEQYNQLTKDYMESKKESEESIKKVTFSCEELFGDFLELESN